MGRLLEISAVVMVSLLMGCILALGYIERKRPWEFRSVPFMERSFSSGGVPGPVQAQLTTYVVRRTLGGSGHEEAGVRRLPAFKPAGSAAQLQHFLRLPRIGWR